MSLLRPLDPSFPIERQIAIEAGPVVLVNVITLDKADAWDCRSLMRFTPKSGAG
jgi:hypothetical protein